LVSKLRRYLLTVTWRRLSLELKNCHLGCFCQTYWVKLGTGSLLDHQISMVLASCSMVLGSASFQFQPLVEPAELQNLNEPFLEELVEVASAPLAGLLHWQASLAYLHASDHPSVAAPAYFLVQVVVARLL
jgi:hypothetical protein